MGNGTFFSDADFLRDREWARSKARRSCSYPCVSAFIRFSRGFVFFMERVLGDSTYTLIITPLVCVFFFSFDDDVAMLLIFLKLILELGLQSWIDNVTETYLKEYLMPLNFASRSRIVKSPTLQQWIVWNDRFLRSRPFIIFTNIPIIIVLV